MNLRNVSHFKREYPFYIKVKHLIVLTSSLTSMIFSLRLFVNQRKDVLIKIKSPPFLSNVLLHPQRSLPPLAARLLDSCQCFNLQVATIAKNSIGYLQTQFRWHRKVCFLHQPCFIQQSNRYSIYDTQKRIIDIINNTINIFKQSLYITMRHYYQDCIKASSSLSATQLYLPALKFKAIGKPIELNTVQAQEEVATREDVEVGKYQKMSICLVQKKSYDRTIDNHVPHLEDDNQEQKEKH